MLTAPLLLLQPKDRISAEAYFGVDNPFVRDVKLYIHEIREVYQKSTTMAKKTFVVQVEKIAALLGETVAKGVNAEKCSLSLIEGENAFCVPMCWDNFKRETRKENTKKIISLEDVIETKNGYRFREPDGKHLIFAIGLHLFDVLDDDEITAILFHEIGHAFQQMLVGINGNIVWANLANSLNQNRMFLDLFSLVVTYGLSIFFLDKTNDMKEILESGSAEVIPAINEAKQNNVDRNKFSANMESYSGRALRIIYGQKVDAEKTSPFVKFFIWIFSKVFETFVGFVKLIIVILSPIFSLFNIFANVYEMTNKGWLKKNKMFEEFADHFSTSYGLGPALSKALAKIHRKSGVDLGTLSFINYVPGLNLYLAWSEYMSTTTASLRAGYPSVENRFAVQRDTLLYELKHNPSLTPKERAEIQEQVDNIGKIYDDFIRKPGSENFVYKVLANVTNRKIQDEKTDVAELVLDVLAQRKADIVNLRKVDKKVDERLKAIEKDPKAAMKYLAGSKTSITTS